MAKKNKDKSDKEDSSFDLSSLSPWIAGAQLGLGVYDRIDAGIRRRKAKKNFQEFQIPGSAKAYLDKATSIASQRGLPGEDIYRNNALGSASRAVETAGRAAGSSSDVLNVLSKVYGQNYMDFEKNMAVSGENAYQRNQGILTNAMRYMAGLEQQRWQYNELYPYMQEMGAAGQQDAAGWGNVNNAVNMGMSQYGAQQQIKSQESMFDKFLKAKLGTGGGVTPMPFSFNSGAYSPQHGTGGGVQQRTWNDPYKVEYDEYGYPK
jgi:hypothetical protein